MNRNKLLPWICAIVLVAISFSAFSQPAQGAGGPDDGGYIYDDINDNSGLAYNWEDISTTGTPISLSDDGLSAEISIPFTFRFYGADYTKLRVSPNGFLTFDTTAVDQPAPPTDTNLTLPNSSQPSAMIAGWWADLNPAASGASVTYQVTGTAPHREFVVLFKDVWHKSGNILTPQKVTFEFKLFETTSDIEIHYNTLDSDGKPHVVGIQNLGGTAGTDYYRNVDVLDASFAVRFQIFTGVALVDKYQIQYGPGGETKDFQVRIANWTGESTRFNIGYVYGSGGTNWPVHVSMTGAIDNGDGTFTTPSMAQGESLYFDVGIDMLTSAPGDSSEAVFTATQLDGTGSYTGTATLIAAVPRRGYVISWGEMGIFPMDTKYNNVLGENISTIEQGSYVMFGTQSPDGTRIVSSDSGSSYNVFVIDLSNPVPPFLSVALPGEAGAPVFTPDSSKIIAPDNANGVTYVMDPATLSTLNTITTVKNPFHVGVSPCVQRKAYITSFNTSGTLNSISVIDLQKNALIKNLTGFNKAYGVVISPLGTRAFVSNYGSGTIGVLDTNTDTLLYTWNIGAGSNLLSGIDISSDGHWLYAAAGTNIYKIDATVSSSTPSYTSYTTPVDKLTELEVAPAEYGGLVYVSTMSQGSESVLVFDPALNQVVKQVNSPSEWYPFGLALFPPESECKVTPVASFTPASQTVRTGETVSWTNTSKFGPTSYLWDFGDGTTSTDEHPTHVYTTAGHKVVTLTATNPTGSHTFTGSVDFAPLAKFTPVDSVITLGTPINFVNESTGNDTLTYAWDFGDGTTSTDKDPSHTYTAIGDYTVTLTVHNSFSPDGVATGTVHFPPAAAFAPSATTIRPGDSITFTNNTTGTDSTAHPMTYLWDFGDGTTSTEKSPTHVYQIATADSVTVTLTAHNGFDVDSTITGTVKFKPMAKFSPAKYGLAALGDPANFTNESTGPGTITYEWNFGDSGTSTDTSPSHTYAAIDNYTVTLTATNGNGSDTFTGTVGYLPIAGFTPVNSIISPGTELSFANTTTGTSTAQNPMTYSWVFGDGGLSSDKDPKHTYAAVGNYDISMTATNEYGSSTATGTVRFPAAASFTPLNPVIKVGDSITFTNTSSGSTPLSYTWNFGDGTATTSTTDGTHTYTGNGPYTVTLTAHNGFGTDGTATTTVNFAPTAKFTTNATVIPSGGSITFTNQSTGTNTTEHPMTYAWDFGDGTTGSSAAASFTHVFTGSGPFHVVLTASNGLGDASTAETTINIAPTANFTPSAEVVKSGQSITFTNTSTGTALTYAWDFGDGGTSTDASPAHTFTGNGPFHVVLTAHNTFAADSTASATINIAPTAAFTADRTTITAGQAVTFTNTSTGTALTYSWDFGDGTSSTSAAASFSHTFAAGTGPYNVALTARNAYAADSKANITINVAPTASFTASKTVIKSGDSVTFTSTSTGQPTLSLSWNFGDGTTGSGTPVSHAFTGSGPFNVVLTASNGVGTPSTAGATINVAPTAGFTIDKPIIKSGDVVTFTNTSTGTALTYAWDFGDGSTGTSAAATFTHTYTGSGPFNVVLTAHNTFGDDSTASATINVAPTAGFTVDHAVVKSGEQVAFTNTSTGTNLTYAWDFGDDITSASPSPAHIFSGNGPFHVVLTVSNTFGPDSTADITINIAPTASFTPDRTVITSGQSVTFTNTSSGTALSYAWAFGDGATSTSTAATVSHTYTGNGPFNVTLTAHNTFAADSTASATINVAPTASFTVDHAVVASGQPVAFTNTSTGTSLTFSWNFGDGTAPVTAASPTHTFTGSGPFNVVLTAHNTFGPDSTANLTINIAPTAHLTANTVVIHSGDTVNFTNGSTGTALAYAWDFGDGSTGTSSAATVQHVYTGNGPFTARLTVSNAFADPSTASVTINVAPTAHFTPQQDVIHLGEDLTITNDSTGTAPLTTTWSFGDGSPTSGEVTPHHIYAATGTYTISLTVANTINGTPYSSTYQGTVVFAPTASFTFSPGNVKPQEPVQFTSTTTGTGTLQYEWDFGDGTPKVSEANPVHSFKNYGSYTVKLTVSNQYDSITVSQTVTAEAFQLVLPLITAP